MNIHIDIFNYHYVFWIVNNTLYNCLKYCINVWYLRFKVALQRNAIYIVDRSEPENSVPNFYKSFTHNSSLYYSFVMKNSK